MDNPKPASHIKFLDGLRGIAAFYVVFGHIHQLIVAKSAPLRLNHYLLQTLRLAHAAHMAVGLFIVLSGYVLMLQVINKPGLSPTGGFKEYIKRRARRILPPYYAALLGTLALVLVVPVMHKPSVSAWNWSAPFIQHGVLASHLLMIQNLRQDWAYKIDPPMWSVATEWQIYFLFPMLLLPVFRRFGGIAAIVTGYALGLVMHFGAHGRLSQACFWYIGLFAMGMYAADTNKRLIEQNKPIDPWRSALWILASSIVIIAVVKPKLFTDKWAYASDLLVGLTAMCLLIVNAHAYRTEGGSRLTRFCDSPPITKLGQMSYSLYLIHYPLLALFQFGLWKIHASDDVQVIGLSLIGVPSILLITKAFHVVFERPFMGSKNRSKPN